MTFNNKKYNIIFRTLRNGSKSDDYKRNIIYDYNSKNNYLFIYGN